MVFPVGAAAPALGIIQGVSGLASAFGGFFDNTAAQEAHEANKLRVAQINQENQRRKFEQLQVNARFNNQKARVQANLSNIDMSAMEARARSQQTIDEALDQYMLDHESRYVRMAQKLSGIPGTGSVTNRSLMAAQGRAAAQGMTAINNAQNKMMTNNAMLARTVQQSRADELARVASTPTQAAYIDSYTPQRAPQKGFMDYLNLAAGIGQAAVSGYETFDSLRPKSPYAGGGNNSLRITPFNPSTFELGMNNPQGYGFNYGTY